MRGAGAISTTFIGAVTAAAALLGGPAAGAAVRPSVAQAAKPTPAAVRRASSAARHALLTRTQLGSGWSVSAPAPKRVPGLTCDRFNPKIGALAPLGKAAAPTFRQADATAFVSQASYVFADSATAGGFWRRVVRRRLLTCVADSLVRGSGHGVHFHVERRHMLALPQIGDRDAAYRVIGTETSSLQSLPVYLDLVVVKRGTGLSAISFSTLESPPSLRLELRLARLVSRHLGAG